MTRIQKQNLWVLIGLAGLVFALLAVPNATGAKDNSMLSLLSQDESFQYPFLMHMLAPGTTLQETLTHLISYNHYLYGYPFYVVSAIAALPVRLIYGAAAPDQVQLNLLLLRQLVSVLPMLVSIVLLVYLQTRFKSLFRSLLIFALLLSIPAVMRQNLNWWHPDALAILCVVLTLFYLDRDELKLGRNFYFAAIACGMASSIKSIGFFFFVAIAGYLAAGLISHRSTWKQTLKAGVLFLLIMVAVFVLTNPLLLSPTHRAAILQVRLDHKYFFTPGWNNGDVYATGLPSWMPVLNRWYGQTVFLLFTLASLGVACFYGEQKRLNRLIAAWALPLGIYLIAFIAIKPDHYWMPVLLPVFSSALGLMPFRLGEPYNKPFIGMFGGLIVIAFLASQFIFNIQTDTFQTRSIMIQERLLISCNSSPENKEDGPPASLEAGTWYRVIVSDRSVTPPTAQFKVMQGPDQVSIRADIGGSQAWACRNETEARFNALEKANEFKWTNVRYRVFGPDGAEILR